MKRLSMGVALVMAAVLLLAAVSAAVPPSFCDDRPEHPQCSSATTTTTTPPSEVQACTTDVLSGISGSGATRFECLWTPAPSDTDTVTTGAVTVTPDGGAISGLVVFVRDASPGDICVLKQEWDGQTGPDFVAEFQLAYSGLDLEEFPDYEPYEE